MVGPGVWPIVVGMAAGGGGGCSGLVIAVVVLAVIVVDTAPIVLYGIARDDLVVHPS